MSILHFSAAEQRGVPILGGMASDKWKLIRLMKANGILGHEVQDEMREIAPEGRWDAARIYTSRSAMNETVSVHFLPTTPHLGPIHVTLNEVEEVTQFVLERLERDDLKTVCIPDDQEYLPITGPSDRHPDNCLHELIAYIGEDEIPLLSAAQQY
jgi:hypothetical protein